MKTQNFQASITYYGGDIPRLKNYKPNCKVLSHFGELDKGIPIEAVNLFKEAQPNLLTYTYPADHGFNCNHRKQYNEKSSRIAFRENLKIS